MGKQESLGIGWGFWLLWVLASTVGWFSGFIIGKIGAFAIHDSLSRHNYMGAVFVAALAAGVGILQWLVLRRRLSRAGWWVLASIVGLAGGGVVGPTAVALAVGDPTTWGVVGFLVVGWAMAGLMQWFVLRRQVSRAGWWVLASIVGWAVSGAVWGLGAQHGMGLEALVVFLAGGAGGAVTGLALVWLLRQPAKEA